jgi:hypothetical protein
MPDVTTHPDFLVSRNGQPLFYLEAIATSNSAREEAEDNRKNRVYDTLDALRTPDFFLGVRVEGAPATPPAGTKLRTDLARWLASLDVENIGRSFEAELFDEIPTFQWEHQGWNIIFEPIPKGEYGRGNPFARPIGMMMPMRATQLNLDEQLRAAVVAKDRYGNVTLPLVVAAQVVNEFRLQRIDVMNGLIGQETITTDNQGTPRSERVPNGAWTSNRGPRHRTISAVMAWSKLDPWDFASVAPFIVHNPYATNPLSNDTFALTQHIVDQVQGVLVEQQGISIAEALGLETDWFHED